MTGKGRNATQDVDSACQGTITVVLADDHALVRAGIRQFLARGKDIEIVGEAADGLEAVDLVRRLEPDVTLMDISMPEITGVEATRRIKAARPQARVLVLTAYDDEFYVGALSRAGADGYILKTAKPEELITAVRSLRGRVGC